MGLTRNTKGVWYLFFAIASHKYVISFCCGMQFINSGLKNWVICVYVSTFSLISPVGVAIGIALIETLESEASAQGSLVVILQGLAAGTLLYVVFFEVIEKERVKGTNGLVQVRTLIQIVLIKNEVNKLLVFEAHLYAFGELEKLLYQCRSKYKL